jgi:hypothetical protein
MKGIDNVFDKIMLALGVFLLALFLMQFPGTPLQSNEHFMVYQSSGDTNYSNKWAFIKPDKAFKPHDVVKIQLRALQQNDSRDSGVITVFNFSSPRNKLHIGPINHFRVMVRNPAYRPMLNFKSYKTGQLVVTGNMAYQLAVITGEEGREEVYLFILAKQQKGKYKGCWMTEGIARMETNRQTSLI